MKRTKRIIINREKGLYVRCHIFDTPETMRLYYKKQDKKAGKPLDDDHDKVLGVHLAYERYHKPKKKWVLHPESGQVLLSLKDCVSSIVAHEFMHAVLHGARHGSKHIQKITIKNMEEEEVLLHDLTNAMRQFWAFYDKVTKRNKFIT
jgi:hypothetical protein